MKLLLVSSPFPNARFVFQLSETFTPHGIEENESNETPTEQEPKPLDELKTILDRSDDSIDEFSSRFEEPSDSLENNPAVKRAEQNLNNVQSTIDEPANEAFSIIEGLDTDQGLQVLLDGGISPDYINTTFEKAGMDMPTAESYLSRISLMNNDPGSVAILKNDPQFFLEHAKAFDPNAFNLVNFHDLNAQGERTELAFDSGTQTFFDIDNPGVPLEGKKDFAVLTDGTVLVGHKHVNLVGHKGASANLAFAGTLIFEQGEITAHNRDTGHFKTAETGSPYKDLGSVDSLNQFQNMA